MSIVGLFSADVLADLLVGFCLLIYNIISTNSAKLVGCVHLRFAFNYLNMARGTHSAAVSAARVSHPQAADQWNRQAEKVRRSNPRAQGRGWAYLRLGSVGVGAMGF